MSKIDHPIDHDEAVAFFRATVVGALATRDLDHGELKAELCRLSKVRYFPPGSPYSRTFSTTTLERWFYAYRHGGIDKLRPQRRSDAGRARALSEEHRQLLIDIRSEYPSASARLILRTLELAKVIEPGAVAPQTVRRLYRQAGLPWRSRKSLDAGLESERQRLRWQSPYISELWHVDVCHALKIARDGKKPIPALVHAILDDHSRYIVRLEVRSTEREQDMLEIFANALREHGVAPRQLYADGGATYTGGVLPIVCERLGTHLLHPAPGDPQARGKGERLFRTMRQQCIDHIRGASSLHDVLVRLLAWRDQYHCTPHSSLMGQTPEQLWREGTQGIEYQRRAAVTHEQLADAYRLREGRRIRKDSTLSIDGAIFEVDALWLGGKKVILERSHLAPEETCVIFEDKRYRVFPVDPEANAARRRKRSPEKQPIVSANPSLPNPADVALEHMLDGRAPKEENR